MKLLRQWTIPDGFGMKTVSSISHEKVSESLDPFPLCHIPTYKNLLMEIGFYYADRPLKLP